MELQVQITAGGSMRTSTLCHTVALHDPFGSQYWTQNVPDLILSVWLILTTCDMTPSRPLPS